jgi:hypothetical protein
LPRDLSDFALALSGKRLGPSTTAEAAQCDSGLVFLATHSNKLIMP